MAVPKGKVSKARRNKRRANWKLSVFIVLYLVVELYLLDKR